MAEQHGPPKGPEPITKWDWPTTIPMLDGYDITQVPDVSRENLQFLADKYNELLRHLFSSDTRE